MSAIRKSRPQTIRRPRPLSARAANASGRAADEALLRDRQWSRLAPLVPGAAASPERTRSLVAESLGALRYGERGSDAMRRRLSKWLREGVWVDLWLAYAATLPGRERDLWQRDLERAARARPKAPAPERAWRLVSLRFLTPERD